MITQIRKIQDAKSGDVIAIGDNRNEVESWCRRIPYGDTLKVQSINPSLVTVRYMI